MRPGSHSLVGPGCPASIGPTSTVSGEHILRNSVTHGEAPRRRLFSSNQGTPCPWTTLSCWRQEGELGEKEDELHPRGSSHWGQICPTGSLRTQLSCMLLAVSHYVSNSRVLPSMFRKTPTIQRSTPLYLSIGYFFSHRLTRTYKCLRAYSYWKKTQGRIKHLSSTCSQP